MSGPTHLDSLMFLSESEPLPQQQEVLRVLKLFRFAAVMVKNYQ
jgi:hypothetical protein